MINLTDGEKAALSDIEESKISELLEHAIRMENAVALHQLPLSSCGPYVSSKLYRFEELLREFRAAKAPKNRERKLQDARKAAGDLSFALSSMKNRMKAEEHEGQLFHVDDHILWPHHFTKKLNVGVPYRWRRSVEDDWIHGSITFHYEYKERVDFTRPVPKRKPSTAQQARDLQDELSKAWEHFMMSALYSVRDFFKEGGDGSAIPSSFQAKVDERSGRLNNHSTVFWK